MRLSQDFFGRDAPTVARDLLGCRLVHRLDDDTCRSGIIIETEAYHGYDDR